MTDRSEQVWTSKGWRKCDRTAWLSLPMAHTPDLSWARACDQIWRLWGYACKDRGHRSRCPLNLAYARKNGLTRDQIGGGFCGKGLCVHLPSPLDHLGQ